MRNEQSINQLRKKDMENVIKNICYIYVIIAIIGLIASLLFDNILTFTFCAIFIILFLGIILIEVLHK